MKCQECGAPAKLKLSGHYAERYPIRDDGTLCTEAVMGEFLDGAEDTVYCTSEWNHDTGLNYDRETERVYQSKFVMMVPKEQAEYLEEVLTAALLWDTSGAPLTTLTVEKNSTIAEFRCGVESNLLASIRVHTSLTNSWADGVLLYDNHKYTEVVMKTGVSEALMGPWEFEYGERDYVIWLKSEGS